MALEWLVHDQMRRDSEYLPNALRVALASHDPNRVEGLFPEFFERSRRAGDEEVINVGEVSPEEFAEMTEGKEVVYDVDMDPAQAEQLANLVGQNLTEWTVTSDMAPSQGVEPGDDDEGWV